MRNGDVLLHHPVRLVRDTRSRRSSTRPRAIRHVLAIKQTLYRTGGDEAGIVASLAKAAEAGKQVVALVELKARFDEQANIERARMLEQAGAHVVYGLVGLKTHAKILLVVRQEADGIRRYCHVGTGNYNPKTADHLRGPRRALGRPRARRRPLASCSTTSPATAARASTAGCSSRRCTCATSLPDADPRRRPGPTGAITMKMNALVDARDDRRAVRGVRGRRAHRPRRARHLLPARRACPGCPRTSPCVRSSAATSSTRGSVRFGEPGDDDTEYIIGSADLMPRNLDRRVEAMLRVTDPRLRARLDEILELNLADDVLAWTLEPDGTWAKVPTVVGLESQVRFQELAVARAKARTPTPDRASSSARVASPTSFGVAFAQSVARLVANEAGAAPRRRSRSRAPGARRDPPAALRPADVRATSSTSDWAHELRGRAALARRRARRGARHRGAAATAARRHRRCCPSRRAGRGRARWSAGSTPTGTARRDALLATLREPALRSSCATALAARPRRPRLHAAGEPARGRRAAAARPPAVAEAAARGRRARRRSRRRRAARGPHPRQAVPLRGRGDDPGVRRSPRASSRAAIADVQDVLGEHQDAVVAGAWLAKTAPECSPAEAYALGMLAEIEARAAARGPRRVPDACGTSARRTEAAVAGCEHGRSSRPRAAS